MSKLTGCIKTGARVHFDNYNIIISADVYRIGDCIAVVTWPGQLDREDPAGPIDQNGPFDLIIRSNTDGDEYWSKDRGVFVVKEDEVIWSNK